MANVTAFVGRDYGVGEHSFDDVVTSTLNALARNGIDGATFSEAVGYWNGDVEQSVRVELIGCSVIDAHAALFDACVELMQWAIVYTIDGSSNVFIENDPTAARLARTA